MLCLLLAFCLGISILLGISIRSFSLLYALRLRERVCMSKSVYVRVFHDLELLRYNVLWCAIEQQL